MMKRAVFLISCAGLLPALTFPRAALAGTNSLLSLEEPLSARAAGMGNAFVSLADDSNAAFFNPAGLGLLSAPQATALYKKEVLDLFYSALSGAYPLSRGTLGLALTDFDGGNLAVNELDGSSFQVKAEQDITLGFSYGFPLAAGLLLGGGLKYVQSDLATYSAQTLAADLGGLYTIPIPSFPGQSLSLGLALLNWGPGIQYDQARTPLPLQVNYGATYRYPLSGDSRLLASAQGSFEESIGTNYSVGAEYAWSFFRARLGYGADTYSAGLGLRYSGQQLDYSINTFLSQILQSVSYTYYFHP